MVVVEDRLAVEEAGRHSCRLIRCFAADRIDGVAKVVSNVCPRAAWKAKGLELKDTDWILLAGAAVVMEHTFEPVLP